METRKMNINRFLLSTAAFAALSAAAPAAAPSQAEVSAARRAAQIYQASAATADFGAIYSSLPDSWRKALSDSVKAFASNSDSGLIGDARDTIRQIAATAVKKSDLLAGMAADGAPFAEMLSESDRRSAIVTYATKIAGVAAAATDSRLAAGDLDGILSAAPLTMKGITDTVPPLSPATATLEAVGQPDGSVKVSGLPSLPGIPGGVLTMVKKDGAWVPKRLADGFSGCAGWPAAAAAARIPDQQVAQTRLMLGMLKGTARQAASAQTQEQLKQYMTQALLPLMMLNGATSGGAQGLPLQF